MNTLAGLLETTLAGMGYELVDFESSNRDRSMRVFIDRPLTAENGAGGITVEDCQAVSNQLTRLFAVENVGYDRLEVSSPGLDRVLKKAADFARFVGREASVKMRLPVNGRRKFTGVIREVGDARVEFDVEGAAMMLELSNLDKARLVPKVEF